MNLSRVIRDLSKTVLETNANPASLGVFEQGVVTSVNSNFTANVTIGSGLVNNVVFLNGFPSIGETVWLVSLGSGRWLGVGVQSAGGVPCGTPLPWPGPESLIPAGFIGMYGQLKNKSEYPTLAKVLGYVELDGADLTSEILALAPWGYWKCDDASGNLVDSSGNGRTMTADNVPTYAQAGAASLTGTSIAFNGTDERASVATTAALQKTNSISFCCWMYLSGSSLKGTAMSVANNTGGGGGVGIGVGNADLSANGNNLIVHIAMIRWIVAKSSIGTGWHHIAVIIDSSGYPIVMLNGQVVYHDRIGAIGNPGASSKVTLGVTAAGAGWNYYGDVRVDEAMVFDKVITPADIERIYASSSGKFLVPDMRDRVWVGLGNQGGSDLGKTVTPDLLGLSLGSDQLMPHSHTTLVNTSYIWSATAGGQHYGVDGAGSYPTGTTGSGEAFEQMPPYRKTNWMIKT